MRMLVLIFVAIALAAPQRAADRPLLTSELIFPLEHWHNHASMVVELPNGDLLACWFHGSGERTADDVVVLGARLKRGATTWGKPFVMADAPGYPDTNATMFLDPKKRLWLMWPTILANEWHTALMKYKIASDYAGEGAPRWEVSEVLHVTPGDEFAKAVAADADRILASGPQQPQIVAYLEKRKKDAADKLSRRLGWMTRAHPYVVDGTRLIVPLYSDGFDLSLMAISDDWGVTWKTSAPLVGPGNIQPSLARRKDGTLVAYMRDNGPAPKRLMISRSTDRGETWSPVEDSELPNPGSGAEVLVLRNGNWVLIYNDLERDRYSLAVSLSEDEGRTWKYTRHLERDLDVADPQRRGQYHYPSIIQAADGTLHATYSYFLPPGASKKDGEGRLVRKSIKHAHFNEAWIRGGSPVPSSGAASQVSTEHGGWDAVLGRLLSSFDTSDVVMLGEAHTRKVDSDLRIRLIRHRGFPAKARFIVVEFGTAAQQAVMDRYVAGEDLPPPELDAVRGAGVRAELVDAVRDVNRSLPPTGRLRLLLAGVRDAPPRERNARAIAVWREHVLSQRAKALFVFGSGHVWHREGGLTRGLEEIIPGRVFVADTLAPVSNGRSGPEYDALDAALGALEKTLQSSARPILLTIRGSAAAQLLANPFYLGQAMLPETTTLGDLHDAVVYFGRGAEAGTLLRPATAKKESRQSD